MSELPPGWLETTFGELFDFKGGSQPPKSTFKDTPTPGYVRLLQIRDFESDAKAVFIRDHPNWPKCTTNDIMIGRYGASVGKILTGKAGAYNVALVRMLFDRKNLDQSWVKLLLLSDYFQQPLRSISRSAQNGFNKTDLEGVPVPLSPLAEQRRIVAKIDSLAVKSRCARDHLDRIPRLVEKYKQAVLAAAFRGDLTRGWRRGRCEAINLRDLEKLRSACWKAVSKTSQRRGRYSPAEDADWLPNMELPLGWTWASVDQLSYAIQYGSSAKTTEDRAGVAVLRMGNLQDGNLDLSSLKFLPADHAEFPDLLLKDGDVLFNRTNSAELVGKTAVFRGELPLASFASYLLRIQTSGMKPTLLSSYINSGYGREWVASVVNQQVGQANVNGSKLRRLGVPVMPPAEQDEIQRRIAAAFTWIERLAFEVTSACRLIDHLDQTLLAKAFRGELVPQDPGDEPASSLLERIRADRAEDIDQGRPARLRTRR